MPLSWQCEGSDGSGASGDQHGNPTHEKLPVGHRMLFWCVPSSFPLLHPHSTQSPARRPRSSSHSIICRSSVRSCTSQHIRTTRTPHSLLPWRRDAACGPAYLSITRGEGGQNLIGPEQGAALGVDPHAGTSCGPLRRRRRTVLHACYRLRLFQDPPTKRCASGTTTPPSPTSCG